MSFAEDIVNIRNRVAETLKVGLTNKEGKDFLEATLIQVLNDAERNRQSCISQAEQMRRQASMLEGQASAFSSVASLVLGVINGYINAAEKEKEERLRLEREQQFSEEHPEILEVGDTERLPIKKKNKIR